MDIDYKNLLEKAKEVSKWAYIPYSKFDVGACVIFESGKTYSGCNVENASYGLSLCAERNALSTAIASGEITKPVAIAIYSSKTDECLPCGACRQWIYEFNPECQVVLQKNTTDVSVYKISELLPKAFVFRR